MDVPECTADDISHLLKQASNRNVDTISVALNAMSIVEKTGLKNGLDALVKRLGPKTDRTKAGSKER